MTQWWRLRVLASAILLVVVSAAIPVSGVAAAPPAVTTANYSIFTLNRVPILNDDEVGVLSATLTGTPASFTIVWSFRGTINGVPSSATGTGSGSGTADQLTLNLDSISSWSMDGFDQPETGKTAYLTRSGAPFGFASRIYTLDLYDFANFSHFIVAGLPLLITPQFAGPFARSNNIMREVGLGTGATDVSSLPGAKTPGPNKF